jgi:hypothetical protein
VNFIGQNHLLERDVLLAEPLNQVDGLAEGDVAIIISMNEQDGGFPSVHLRIR